MIPTHPKQPFFIGGYSPNVHNLPVDILNSGVVIGINEFPRLGRKMDYWLCCDTDSAMHHLPDLVASITVPKFMQRYAHVPDAPADYWFARSQTIPTKWEEKLAWNATSACAAVNLACLMGASTIYLYGVDFVSNSRADGTEYETDGHWQRYAQGVSKWMNECVRLFGVKIYKMHPDSPLALPYYEASTQ